MSQSPLGHPSWRQRSCVVARLASRAGGSRGHSGTARSRGEIRGDLISAGSFGLILGDEALSSTTVGFVGFRPTLIPAFPDSRRSLIFWLILADDAGGQIERADQHRHRPAD